MGAYRVAREGAAMADVPEVFTYWSDDVTGRRRQLRAAELEMNNE